MKDTNLTEEISAVLEEFALEEQVPERVVYSVDETHILIGDVTYEIIEDYRDGFDIEAMNARYQDIFARYDYIVGDWGHDKLRLKGFFNHKHRLATPDRDIDYLQDYLKEYCNFGCKYFVLERDPNAIYVPAEEESYLPKRSKQKSSNKRQQRKTDKQNRTTAAASKEDRPQKQQRSQRKTTKASVRPDFELKEMTQKETFKQTNTPTPRPKQSNKKRNFQMKEVDQTPKPRVKNTKPTKNNLKKRFDIREKPTNRGN